MRSVYFSPSTPYESGQYYAITQRATYPAPSGIYDLSGNPLSYVGFEFET